MFLLNIIKSEEFITQLLALVGTLIIALILFALYNSSYIIRKKTRIEAKQKLELDSIVGVINGAEELHSAVGELNVLITNMTIDILPQMNNKNYSEIEEVVREWKSKFIEYSRLSKKKIDKFAFLIIKDARINKGNNQEYEAIKDELLKIQKMPKEIIETIEKIKDPEMNGQNLNDIAQKIKADAEDRFKIVNEFIDSLLIIYAVKLDRGGESWFRQLLNWFCKR